MSHLFNDAIGFSKETILKNGEMLPTFIANTISGERFYIVCPWSDEKEKQLIINVVRLIFMSEYVNEYIFLSECWMKYVSDVNKLPIGTISNDPDKIEALMCVYAKRENEKIFKDGKFFEIIRTPKIELKEQEFSKDFEGALSSMLTSHVVNLNESEAIKELIHELSGIVSFKIIKQPFQSSHYTTH